MCYYREIGDIGINCSVLREIQEKSRKLGNQYGVFGEKSRYVPHLNQLDVD